MIRDDIDDDLSMVSFDEANIEQLYEESAALQHKIIDLDEGLFNKLKQLIKLQELKGNVIDYTNKRLDKIVNIKY